GAALVADPEARELPRRHPRPDLQLPARPAGDPARGSDPAELPAGDLLHPHAPRAAARPRPDRRRPALLPPRRPGAEPARGAVGAELPGADTAAEGRAGGPHLPGRAPHLPRPLATRLMGLDADPRRAAPPRTLSGDVVATVAAFGIVAILGIGLVGGFRASPWLDDTWYFWLPKGRALDLAGLDPRLWTPQPALHMLFGHDYESLTFIRPDNPLWWSILLNLDM